jgi:hypothetical protein
MICCFLNTGLPPRCLGQRAVREQCYALNGHAVASSFVLPLRIAVVPQRPTASRTSIGLLRALQTWTAALRTLPPREEMPAATMRAAPARSRTLLRRGFGRPLVNLEDRLDLQTRRSGSESQREDDMLPTRLVSYLAMAAVIAALTVPTVALAVTPVDESGTSAPSEPKANPPSPSNQATSGSSSQQGTSGGSATSGASGPATSGASGATGGAGTTESAMPPSEEASKERGRNASGPTGGAQK